MNQLLAPQVKLQAPDGLGRPPDGQLVRGGGEPAARRGDQVQDSGPTHLSLQTTSSRKRGHQVLCLSQRL